MTKIIQDEMINNIYKTWNFIYNNYLKEAFPYIKHSGIISDHKINEIIELSKYLDIYFSKRALSILEDNVLKNIYNILQTLMEELKDKNNNEFTKEEQDRVLSILSEIENLFVRQSSLWKIDSIKTYMINKVEQEISKEKQLLDKEMKLLQVELNNGVISSIFKISQKNFSKQIKKQTCSFYVILFIIFCIALICIPKTIPGILVRLSLILPLAWAALFLSKRINEDKKLEQAYLHKQTVAQSFVTYLNFIKENNLQDTDLETLKTLNRVMIESLGLNPALLLDKSTSEKIPMEELLSRILDKTILDKKS
ncbi:MULTISPECIES: hypothetical protein [unclassified Avibacterium]|uniref:hypothetical protein n=1 Tax=unclassified Avibacterium TaxID=2685287 RepID=UPI00218C3BAB|nr:hypothetical protein [Avibacterium sp. 20-129]MCW9698503.1 hypothetical protein [Avibacterium sp. 20-129]URL02609.1 hypothetical protein L4F91_03120 [Avibacterium sp. 20-126]